VIVEVDGQTVRSPNELGKKLDAHHTGDTVAIGFLRDGTRRRVTAVLNGKEP
jgi:S1-C subfamily serine protease